ncbi:MAG: mechanosensitive ion channel family protein [Bacilli bacterium]|nr:mechanosensitive ion channel family protein [Bacilli bacterium]MDD4076614.1 mechanosensitive ion channel family protein [Bacilli bacterium]MDD4387934.1 mechanosensitive ion channel family protein [Bacilli bacterium]
MENIRKFIETEVTKVIFTAIVLVLTVLIWLIVGTLVNRFIKRKRDKRKRAATMARLMQSIFRYILIIIMVIVILGIWGVNVTPILAGAGIIGIVIGLGAQSLIRDLLAGLSIVFENYYDIGDVVEIKGYKGTVMEIGLKSTKIQNWKGEVKIFSNGDIIDVTNFSKNPTIAIVDIDVSHRHNIDFVIDLLEENLNSLREVFTQIIEGPNVIGITAVGAAGSTVRIIVKTASEEHYAVERGIRKFVKELFEKNNIEFSLPRMVVHNDKYPKI